MKTFTYAAAIALLTASAAFAQPSDSSNMNSGNMNSGTSSPSVNNPSAAGADSGQTGISANKPASLNHQPTAPQDSSMAQPNDNGRDMGRDMSSDANSGKTKTMKHEASKTKSRHVASRNGSNMHSEDARENRITAQLNQSQLSGNGRSSLSGMDRNGTAMNGKGNSFGNGRPQSAQAGGSDCTPDNPSCGTARENPAINSSPQHRLEQASPAATANE